MEEKAMLAGPGDPLEAFSVPRMAALLGVTAAAVREWIKDGDLPSIELGNRRRILRQDLERFLAANRVTGFRQLRPNQYPEAHRDRHPETLAAPDLDDDCGGNENIPFDSAPGR